MTPAMLPTDISPQHSLQPDDCQQPLDFGELFGIGNKYLLINLLSGRLKR